MLTTYDRVLREYRRERSERLTELDLKRMEQKYAREDEPKEVDTLTVPGVTVALLMRQAVKDSMRDMEGM